MKEIRNACAADEFSFDFAAISCNKLRSSRSWCNWEQLIEHVTRVIFPLDFLQAFIVLAKDILRDLVVLLVAVSPVSIRFGGLIFTS